MDNLGRWPKLRAALQANDPQLERELTMELQSLVMAIINEHAGVIEEALAKKRATRARIDPGPGTAGF